MSKMAYFEPILSGRFRIDEEEALFIDRDPDIFAVVPSMTFENANRVMPIYLVCSVSNLPPIYPQ